MDNASEKYARALAGSAVQAGLLAEARKDFDRLMSMLSSSKELRFVLMRRGFSSEDEKKALKSVL
jgi:F0F1-type ATP synthase delta subunit